MKKRLLSLVIILAMAISLFPTMPLTASAEDVVYEYVFADEAAGTTALSSVSEYTTGSGQWMYFTGNVSKANRQTYKTGHTTYVQSKVGQWVAVKIKIPAPAVYSAALTYATGNADSSAGIGNVYLLPGDTSKDDIESVLATEAAKDLGMVKYAGSSNAMATAPQALSNITVEDGEEGEYIVVFKATGVREGKEEGYTSSYMYLTQLTLTKVADVEITDYADYTFNYTFVDDIADGTDVHGVKFKDTKAMWSYDSGDGMTRIAKDGEGHTSGYGIEARAVDGDTWFAFRINIPAPGLYKASYLYMQRYVYGGYGDIYFLPGDTADIPSALSEENKINNEEIKYYGEGTHYRGLTLDLKNIDIEKAGEYLLVFYGTKKGAGYYADQAHTGGEGAACRQYPHGFTLTGDGNNPAYAGVVTIPSVIEKGTSATETVSVWNTATGEEITDGITLTSSNADVATVSGTTVTAVSAGETTITATCSSPVAGNIIGADVTVVPTAQETADAAFITDGNKEENISYTASDLKGLTVDGNVINGVPNGDGSYNLTAPEKNNAGYEFVYWAKGNVAKKRILLFQTNELENYVPDESGVTYLIPVYEDMLPKTPEYYNANGQLIPDAKDSDRPYMAGYGTASGWKQYGETNIWVTEYNNKTQPDNVTVTVENGTGTATLPYGEKVTCIANEAEEGTYFRWWQKDVNGTSEIVSVDKEYSFLAYENCTVTAVYGDSAITVTNPAKIIIDTFGENSIMAEFIGFGNNVVEKGIMWNNNRIAMTGAGNQFTVTADKNGTFKGYAIVKDGDAYTLITDGEATIRGLAE